ncbi:ATP-binding protein [Pseudorhodoferax sp. Leaf267]|uniref:ATP-binding protein n=1 Tax=Pseudorhodoferax sp. Leaf267 TaxID=1736316 RepID=UPI0006F928D5|nr:ATP-binding protein [Pseudorhodoferax sp. Leaf267]KQP23355.1 ATPase [Pseudorhodoferax sp. Leaf267]
MQIQVHIDEDGALRNQRYAFSHRFTLVTELLQNARRAGARHIEVVYDHENLRLVVQDDGCGLQDFQALLTFHRSGWDHHTLVEEHPFGVGFTQCLYAATRCVVHSGHHRVDIDTHVALRRMPCEVVQTDTLVQGTRVELHGVDLSDLPLRMERLCQGFPVEVMFNGQRLVRRYAEDCLVFEHTPLGAVHLTGRYDGRAVRGMLVFLQGFCVHTPSYFETDRVNVVHLDPRQFVARLPDRDLLIDADQQLPRIEAQLHACWRHQLHKAQASLPERQYVDTYYGAMRCWSLLELLNDLDELPTALFERIGGYPVQGNAFERAFMDPVAKAPSRAEIEQGQVRLVALDDPHADNAAHWMLARAGRWLVVRPYGLDARHWVQRHLQRLDEAKADVEALDVQAHAQLDGRWVRPRVVLCRAVRIRVGTDQAVVEDAAVCHGEQLLVPEGEHGGESVRQLSDFLDDNERRRDGELDADREALAALIWHLRSTDAQATMTALLATMQLGRYPLLHGCSFEVSVGAGAAPGCSVELVGSPLTAIPLGEVHGQR